MTIDELLFFSDATNVCLRTLCCISPYCRVPNAIEVLAAIRTITATEAVLGLDLIVLFFLKLLKTERHTRTKATETG
ncbi:hypothetical protein PMHK_11960 [Pseudomonas sp. MHK4]